MFANPAPPIIVSLGLLNQKNKKDLPPPPSGLPPIDPQRFVKLVSQDGHVFVVDRECAKVSRVLKNLLATTATPGGTTAPMGATQPVMVDEAPPMGATTEPARGQPADAAAVAAAVVLPPPIASLPTIRFTVSARLLEKAIQYFYYKNRYDGDPDHRPGFHVPPDMALDLIHVANQLQC